MKSDWFASWNEVLPFRMVWGWITSIFGELFSSVVVCNLTMVLSNFGLWFLFCLGIMTSRETRRKPMAESTMLSQNQRNSSYRSLVISFTHAVRPPPGVPGDGGNKTTETNTSPAEQNIWMP